MLIQLVASCWLPEAWARPWHRSVLVGPPPLLHLLAPLWLAERTVLLSSLHAQGWESFFLDRPDDTKLEFSRQLNKLLKGNKHSPFAPLSEVKHRPTWFLCPPTAHLTGKPWPKPSFKFLGPFSSCNLYRLGQAFGQVTGLSSVTAPRRLCHLEMLGVLSIPKNE
jgi:hypothetical protein